MPTERRKFPRRKPDQLSYINLETENGGMLLDLSEGGVGFHAVSPIDPSAGNLRFWFSVKSIDRIDAEGQIVWTDENRKSGGLRFVHLPEQARKQIRAWLTSPVNDTPAAEPVLPAAAPPAPEQVVMSDFDARAEEVIGVAEAAFGGAIRDTYSDVSAAASTEPSAEELLSRDAGNRRGAAAVSVAAVAAVVNGTPPTAQSAGRLVVTPGGIRINPSAHPADAAARSQRRYSMLFDEGDPDEVDAFDSARYQPIQRQSQTGVVLGTLAVLALIGCGVYGYLYHDRVGAFLESLGSRMTQSRTSSQSPQTVSAAPPDSQNPAAQQVPQSTTTDAGSQPAGTAPPNTNGSATQPGEQPVPANPAALPAQPAGTAANPNPTATGDPTASTPGSSSKPAGVSSSAGATSPESPKNSGSPATETSAVSTPAASNPAKAESTKPDRTDRQRAKSESGNLPAPGEPEGGAEELASARKLLGASHGRAENLRAVQLLWSSVEKGNLEAEIELADLYASGYRVPKNCTQARVLLQSAAKRDSSEALHRLATLGSCK
ncbi:MAG TPA: PilZ domain-containing protein [Candidatus Acidoferrales bacterium]|nr:PilZ domain-containing protein [Candidatus Acidoferrales bacterium]